MTAGRLSTAAAAARTGVHPNTIRNWHKTGRITAAETTRAGYRYYDAAEVDRAARETLPGRAPSYHDLHITTARIPRTRIFDLPYNLMVTCCRTAGWVLWDTSDGLLRSVHVAGEYSGPGDWLVLDVGGHVIVDGRSGKHEVG